MHDEWMASVRTIEEAREFVLEVGVCGILHNKTGAPSLCDAVDAPDKQPGEPGWGEKMGKVWAWKNELPARYPDEIFYGKRSGGGAILCSMDALKELYVSQHRPLADLSEVARSIYEFVAQAPATNAELKELTNMRGKECKSTYDRALQELQVALQIVRVNLPDIEGDTWTPFTSQYPDFSV